MSEELREQFEAWFVETYGDTYAVSKVLLLDAFQACAKIKDAEIQRLETKLEFAEAIIAGNNVLLSENEELKYALDGMTMFRDGKVKEIEQLNARVAMMREALDKLARLGNEPHYGNSIGNDIAKEAINATEADVNKWVNGVKADALEQASDIAYDAAVTNGTATDDEKAALNNLLQALLALLPMVTDKMFDAAIRNSEINGLIRNQVDDI